jgi:4-hydroxythreonine-4-phosphate dehydrogenase
VKTIGITMGDPLGIGAEIIQKALPKFRGKIAIKVFGDPDLLTTLPAQELIRIQISNRQSDYTPTLAGLASVAYLDRAMDAYAKKEIDALVTAPISKSHVKLAGFPFPGHTEYLAQKTNTQKFVMMMASSSLKVTLVTIHEPLKNVSSLLSINKILDTVEVTHRSLQEKFHISSPRIAVCGLNPHAGEGGLLGSEEKEIIAPAIAEANRSGYSCSGPMVPDAVFHEIYQGKWDAVVCMYHDQGLIPFKMIHFRDGVNVTLGLPLIRTSPDHGTAFDIAGKGIADSSSIEAAIQMAIEMLG